jgi:predicted DNA-binding transcriptional regulator AlpA
MPTRSDPATGLAVMLDGQNRRQPAPATKPQNTGPTAAAGTAPRLSGAATRPAGADRQARAELARFLEAFGPDGTQYFLQGKTFEEATALFAQHTPLGRRLAGEKREYLKASEAAALFAVSAPVWMAWAQHGWTPRAVPVGRSLRWSLASIRQWAQANCPEGNVSGGKQRPELLHARQHNLLTATECAARFGIGYTTWLSWVNQGIVPPGSKIGGKLLWSLVEVENCLRSRTPRQ